MLHRSDVFAWWLYTHPGKCVYGSDHKTLFWYDEEKDEFFRQNVSNKIHHGVYIARGLKPYLRRYCEFFASAD